MPYDARPVANFLLDAADARGFALTNMALNKVLYFCQGWHLAREKAALINNNFEAWEHGPVIPIIYHQFKKFKSSPILDRTTTIDFETGADITVQYKIDDLDCLFLIDMLQFYGPRPASVLRTMSHEPGAPWDNVWNGGGSLGMTISDESIGSYFTARLAKKRRLDVN